MRFGIALSHASSATCGPDLVVGRRATRVEAEIEAAAVMAAQPGITAAVAEHDGHMWRIGNLTIPEWINTQ